MDRLIFIIIISLLVFFLTSGCKNSSEEKSEKKIQQFESLVEHPDWSKNVVLYEINIRQFTEDGTINAFQEHLPRLKELGVDVLWFMPIHPIGVVNRKGELGSYYSVRDYRDINPEFGTLEDFKNLLSKAHESGFYVMLDWVPNHTSWDNHMTKEHPEWYLKDSTGEFIPPIGTDWTDVIQLDWSQKGLQDYMLDALTFWVDLGVDGFRVDHPHKTPKEFWERVKAELEKIRPVLMLAENEEHIYFLEKGFDMNYAWELHHMMNEVAQGKKSVKNLAKYFNKEQNTYPNSVYRLRFLTNHDENSWQGTINERMGAAHKTFAVFMFTMPGTPLLYNGQEVCLDKRLKFFEKDPIEWEECEMTDFYKELIELKKENKALWNGTYGGPMNKIKTSKDNRIFAFFRGKDDNKTIVFLNLSKNILKIKPGLDRLTGEYTDYFNGETVSIPMTDSLQLEAWDYRVFVK